MNRIVRFLQAQVFANEHFHETKIPFQGLDGRSKQRSKANVSLGYLKLAIAATCTLLTHAPFVQQQVLDQGCFSRTSLSLINIFLFPELPVELPRHREIRGILSDSSPLAGLFSEPEQPSYFSCDIKTGDY